MKSKIIEIESVNIIVEIIFSDNNSWHQWNYVRKCSKTLLRSFQVIWNKNKLERCKLLMKTAWLCLSILIHITNGRFRSSSEGEGRKIHRFLDIFFSCFRIFDRFRIPQFHIFRIVEVFRSHVQKLIEKFHFFFLLKEGFLLHFLPRSALYRTSLPMVVGLFSSNPFHSILVGRSFARDSRWSQFTIIFNWFATPSITCMLRFRREDWLQNFLIPRAYVIRLQCRAAIVVAIAEVLHFERSILVEFFFSFFSLSRV